MIIHILRHGQSESNAQRTYAGSTDTPLSQAGRQQATNGCISPEVSRVYVTPLMRTQQTAAILFPQAEQLVVPGLREIEAGIFEGRGFAELDTDPAYIAWTTGDGSYCSPGGESRMGFALRVSRALASLINEAGARGEEELYIVAHGGTIMALMAAHALPQQDYTAWWVENLEGYQLHVDDRWHKEGTFAQVNRLNYARV